MSAQDLDNIDNDNEGDEGIIHPKVIPKIYVASAESLTWS